MVGVKLPAPVAAAAAAVDGGGGGGDGKCVDAGWNGADASGCVDSGGANVDGGVSAADAATGRDWRRKRRKTNAALPIGMVAAAAAAGYGSAQSKVPS